MTRPGYDWQTPKPRSPMPIRVEIWDTKNSGLDALAWAPRAANFCANIAAGFAIAFFVLVAAVRVGWL